MVQTVRKSLRDRLALQIMLLTTAIIATLTVVAVVIAGAHTKQRIMMQLSSEATAKEDLIERRLRQDWEHASLWARQIPSSRGELEQILTAAQEEGIPLVGTGLFSADGQLQTSAGFLSEESLIEQKGGGLPIVTNDGWVGHMVMVPMALETGAPAGFFVAQFDMRGALTALVNVTEIGESAELLLGKEEQNQLVLVQHKYIDAGQTKSIGALSLHIARNDPLARAVLRQEGVIRTTNYENTDVFASYRFLPRLGWGLVLTIDANEALIGVWSIAIAIATVGLLLLGMAILLSISFAYRLTAPLQKIAGAMRELGPNHWEYESTVDTQDELQLVDETVAEMTGRLRSLYEDMETKISDRTQELRDQYEMDRAILDSTLHGVILVAPDGHIISLNPAAAKSLCQNADMCQNLPASQVFKLFRKNKPVAEDQHPITECLRTGQPVIPKSHVHWSLQSSTSEMIAVNLTVTPVFNGDKLLGAVTIFRDITEERHVDQVKSEFISLASHQLRTPLSVIKWYTELLGESGKDLELNQEYLKEIQNAGDRMSNLVDALLQAAQLESRGVMAEKVDVDMNTFISGLEKELELMAKEKEVKCRLQIPKEKISLQTDPVLLHVVIQNLFSNAVKYTNSGGTITISLAEKENKVILTVKDTGIGIPSKDHENIFQRLFRAKNAKQSVADGSGLGLYISRMVLEILGGEIDFKSKEDAGTTFIVELPKE